MSKQKAERIPNAPSSSDNTEDRKKVETLVDELLDTVMGGMGLCQHCNQPCGDCTQPPIA